MLWWSVDTPTIRDFDDLVGNATITLDKATSTGELALPLLDKKNRQTGTVRLRLDVVRPE